MKTYRMLSVCAMAMLLAAAGLARVSWAQPFVQVNDPQNPIVVDATRNIVHGCAWVDYDHDGWLDLFIADSLGSWLYHNEADGSFTRVTSGPLVTESLHRRGSAWADYDNDGDIDCALTGNTETSIFANLGTGDFVRRFGDSVFGTTDTRGYAVAWADYDNDGDLDLVATFPQSVWQGQNLRANRFWRNNGPPDFTFTTVDTGVIATDLKAYTIPTWSDYDQDGDLDLFIGSGPITGAQAPDDLYRNLLSETGLPGFERIVDSPLATDLGDGQVWNWIDYDNDGDLDAYRINFGPNFSLGQGLPNRLYRNDSGVFVHATGAGPIHTDARNSLSLNWGDFDNDGDLDCFVVNGVNQADDYYVNNGDGTFSLGPPGDYQGGPTSQISSSAGDYDNDGDLDLIVITRGVLGRRLLENTTSPGPGWIRIQLQGVFSPHTPAGARVWALATVSGTPRWQLRELSTQNTFCGHNSLDLHFGFGDAAIIDSLRVEWPSGVVTDTAQVAINQILTLVESCPDPDSDGVSCFDNCPADSNSSQADSDGDGAGDACDACPGHDDRVDTDADGVADGCDNCPDLANPLQEDANFNGVGDLCECPFTSPGDIDESGSLTSADIIRLVNFVFKSGATPLPCQGNADINCSGAVTSADIIAFVNHVFKGGPPPCDICTLFPTVWSCP